MNKFLLGGLLTGVLMVAATGCGSSSDDGSSFSESALRGTLADGGSCTCAKTKGGKDAGKGQSGEDHGKSDAGKGQSGEDHGKADAGMGQSGEDHGKADAGMGQSGEDHGKADAGKGQSGEDHGKADGGMRDEDEMSDEGAEDADDAGEETLALKIQGDAGAKGKKPSASDDCTCQ